MASTAAAPVSDPSWDPLAPGVPLNYTPWFTDSEIPDLRPSGIPPGCEAVYAPDLGAIIGYVSEYQGVLRVYAVDGRLVEMSEPGLEQPLFDPIDLLFILGPSLKLLKGLIWGGERLLFRSTARAAAGVAGYSAARAMGVSTRSALQLVFRSLTSRPLLFTETTLVRMADPARRVPLHILQLAIRHGTRSVDAQMARGAYTYITPMWRQVVSGGERVWRQYTLKVVVRESDWTVLHFHYF